MDTTHASGAERRKQLKLRLRADLNTVPQKYEGRTHYVVKDPVSLKYYRFSDKEHFVLNKFDGKHSLEEIQKDFEKNFRPHRLTLEDLEHFARQLVTAGLIQHESGHAAKHLYERRKKQKRLQKIATFTNFLYVKIPVFDPDRLLTAMLPYTRWIFTKAFLAASVGLMLAAVLLVATHFQAFYDRLPNYQEFFRFNTLLYMWIALGIVKVIHEFGHGLSCKAFGGECHEMGFLLMCLSPALYCNVTDSWTVADKWKRIIISFAGIYVELVIAAIATFVWWETPGRPFINNVALCVMVLCSVSTVVFNANPLMRFDGYYMMADWLEIPNLRERSNRVLKNLASEKLLGIEVPPEQYMEPGRFVLFIAYAVVSYVYRWVVTFSIIYFLSEWLKPYKLGSLSMLLAVASAGTMVFWPMYRLFKGINQRGRLPDMKPARVAASSVGLAVIVAAFFLLPLPVSRVHSPALVQVQPEAISKVYLPRPGGVMREVYVHDGQWVEEGTLLASFDNLDMENKLLEAQAQARIAEDQVAAARKQLSGAGGPVSQKGRAELEAGKKDAEGEYEKAMVAVRFYQDQLSQLKNVKAPRAGFVMSPPLRNDIGKYWDAAESGPFCGIGDQQSLRVLLPVSPADYRLIKEDLQRARGRSGPATPLDVSIHCPGRTDRVFTGEITQLPESDAKEVPVQLTQRGGGPLAVKPNEKPGVYVPQSQQYLIPVRLADPDATVQPGSLAQIKVHCEWRTAAWWVWRSISQALDVGLI